ncbi:MAG: carbohydrate kinase family protein [Euryarchaeota archaeon]|nr:carbohydrate kinase family protein [Euryarchaeota archaeon]
MRGRQVAQRANFVGIFGHTTIDRIMEVPKFPEPNTSIEVRGQRTYRGGTGANIAFLMARMGGTPALASFVGEDFPKDYEDALRSAGVDVTDLVRCEKYSTPTCMIVTDPDERQVAYIDQGPMRDAERFEVLAHSVDTSKLVHFGTGRPEYYSKVAAYATKRGKKIALDPSQEIHYVYDKRSFAQMLEMADIMFANGAELATALEYIGGKSPRALLDHVDVLVVTRGKRGSELYVRDSFDAVPAMPPRRMVDPTGAGDSYRAGFYAAWERGRELTECALAGSAAASFVIESEGAQTNPPTWDAVLERLRKNGCAID